MAVQLPPSAAEAAAIAGTREFIARFSMEIMPFCPTGMALLHDLARTDTELYEWGSEIVFANLDHPGFAQRTKLASHVALWSICSSPC